MAALAGAEKAVAGLAKDIRESEEPQEQWDLAGYSEGQINALVEAAYATPIRLPEMVKHTFVIGGGKKVKPLLRS